eukprot:CAMPEP_0196783250 /NCGR_PEP_ID=MMETSP1104-20130614/13212_1 /TAXON_ID=33652 /ORGANISM="Cafeteria sp., Strain Caron Lab Isolate" /LENGTH=110 /DNA_ID=CAMNT_0042153497 /DNA_START=17 /DNA_END=346 /DNA_ORIENTATION=+
MKRSCCARSLSRSSASWSPSVRCRHCRSCSSRSRSRSSAALRCVSSSCRNLVDSFRDSSSMRRSRSMSRALCFKKETNSSAWSWHTASAALDTSTIALASALGAVPEGTA